MCLRWYFRYKLSYRDLVEMMAERGLPIVHTTILRWAVRYAEEFEKRWRRYERAVRGVAVGCAGRGSVGYFFYAGKYAINWLLGLIRPQPKPELSRVERQ